MSLYILHHNAIPYHMQKKLSLYQKSFRATEFLLLRESFHLNEASLNSVNCERGQPRLRKNNS